jgi:hypothetical protein
MSVKTTHDPRSRFIKAYLLTWGLLAAGGLGYLVTLTLQGDPSPTPARQEVAETDPGMRPATRAEVSAVRRNVGDLRRDLGELKDTVDRRENEEKAVHSRLTTLEERVTSLSVQAAAPPPNPKQVAIEKAQKAAAERAQKAAERSQRIAAEKSQATATEPRPATIISAIERPEPKAVPVETGSISPGAPIRFGEAVVMPTRDIFGVQLAAAPSLESLRLSWSLLVERHGAELATLQPRYVAPTTAGGSYRLVAGPLTSAAEAERICVELQTRRASCRSTDYIGEPL